MAYVTHGQCEEKDIIIMTILKGYIKRIFTIFCEEYVIEGEKIK
jgi:hypothetical protein